jgi:hypothetical protein
MRRAFIEMNRWTKYKQDMVHSIKSEAINKRKGYEKQMRKPVLIPVKMPYQPKPKQDHCEPMGETIIKESEVLNTNYLTSAEYIFKAAKQKRELIDSQKAIVKSKH